MSFRTMKVGKNFQDCQVQPSPFHQYHPLNHIFIYSAKYIFLQNRGIMCHDLAELSYAELMGAECILSSFTYPLLYKCPIFSLIPWHIVTVRISSAYSWKLSKPRCYISDRCLQEHYANPPNSRKGNPTSLWDSVWSAALLGQLLLIESLRL